MNATHTFSRLVGTGTSAAALSTRLDAVANEPRARTAGEKEPSIGIPTPSVCNNLTMLDKQAY